MNSPIFYWRVFYFYEMKKILLLLSFFLFVACAERPEQLELKLSDYLQEDLKFMVAEVMAGGQPSALLDSPYYVIRDLRFFEGASAEIYSAYAEVDFFVYDKIPMFQKRKYRYDVHYRQWDRYLKKWNYGTFSE